LGGATFWSLIRYLIYDMIWKFDRGNWLGVCRWMLWWSTAASAARSISFSFFGICRGLSQALWGSSSNPSHLLPQLLALCSGSVNISERSNIRIHWGRSPLGAIPALPASLPSGMWSSLPFAAFSLLLIQFVHILNHLPFAIRAWCQ